MAYSETINLVVGDTLPELTITLKDSNTAASGQTLDENDSTTWNPISLSGKTVKLRLRELGTTTVKSTLSCTVTNASGGVVTTDFPSGTLDTAGTFEGEVEITTTSGGAKQTVNDLLKFKVRDDFD
ncbi:MAG: hypothetical protein CBD86_02015 [Gammaproteobacteria bacterium TMED226]|nr:MAG: hypothetical protein CBD86_02015 [Gammaproteobacteria bacterium TMED226]|tara:strand:+ start:599 stop:976 length:378 start_codon:yes stop_codon:yes gene_type:complete